MRMLVARLESLKNQKYTLQNNIKKGINMNETQIKAVKDLMNIFENLNGQVNEDTREHIINVACIICNECNLDFWSICED